MPAHETSAPSFQTGHDLCARNSARQESTRCALSSHAADPRASDATIHCPPRPDRYQGQPDHYLPAGVSNPRRCQATSGRHAR